ncbi:hypothetical protein L596_022256 [Steinernema carpocapsae]|uniref:Uncharacterized protein n=1 Tax=Steinernema carpocapsae TaxID=34508 RepID=A0A4U5ML89_STECR|nr:hypothetical protein L596_022256 [Steinernema carpocapsae]
MLDYQCASSSPDSNLRLPAAHRRRRVTRCNYVKEPEGGANARSFARWWLALERFVQAIEAAIALASQRAAAVSRATISAIERFYLTGSKTLFRVAFSFVN